LADDPLAVLDGRLEVARMSGVPTAALERYRERNDKPEELIDGIHVPDRELVPGVEVESDVGTWQVIETPGHAPSHVCLHQAERRLLISGDHLLGRTVLFFDYGHTPDPLGEYRASLDRIEPLDVDLCLPGHGKPFREPAAKIAEVRRESDELLGKVRAHLVGVGAEPTAFEIVEAIVGKDNIGARTTTFVLQIILSCLDHLAAIGEITRVPDSDPQRWRA
jgi:glyoxylase-like metal-dependent hydrolase (beta-lactamase superfamily II)